MKKYSIILGAVLVTACASNAPVQVNSSVAYQPDNQARIRMYGQNQKPSVMFSNIDCARNPRGTKVNVGGRLGDAVGSLAGTVKSSSIGIPDTEISKAVGDRNGLMSRAFFREFVVEADKPVNVQAAYVGLNNRPTGGREVMIYQEGSCKGRIASFIPRAGRDYEVVGSQGRSCSVSVFEVDARGTLTPVELSNRYRCGR